MLCLVFTILTNPTAVAADCYQSWEILDRNHHNFPVQIHNDQFFASPNPMIPWGDEFYIKLGKHSWLLVHRPKKKRTNYGKIGNCAMLSYVFSSDKQRSKCTRRKTNKFGSIYPLVTSTISTFCREPVSASGIRRPTYAFPP